MQCLHYSCNAPNNYYSTLTQNVNTRIKDGRWLQVITYNKPANKLRTVNAIESLFYWFTNFTAYFIYAPIKHCSIFERKNQRKKQSVKLHWSKLLTLFKLQKWCNHFSFHYHRKSNSLKLNNNNRKKKN